MKYHKLSCLKTIGMCSLMLLEVKSPKQDADRAMLSLKTLGEESFLASSWLPIIASNLWHSLVKEFLS